MKEFTFKKHLKVSVWEVETVSVKARNIEDAIHKVASDLHSYGEGDTHFINETSEILDVDDNNGEETFELISENEINGMKNVLYDNKDGIAVSEVIEEEEKFLKNEEK